LENPSYEMVCSGTSGHTEAVEVDFDPAEVSYETLLAVFWDCHDPTTLNRQGPDVGTQYRSGVFVHDGEQEAAARASKQENQSKFGNGIVSELPPRRHFTGPRNITSNISKKTKASLVGCFRGAFKAG
jgi:peptide-methionine (S)-S-oxide reductase